MTVHESAVATLPPLISVPFYTDRLTALIKNEGTPAIATLVVAGSVPFPRDSYRITNQGYAYPTGRRNVSDSDDQPGDTIRLSAFFGAGDPPRWASDTDWGLPKERVRVTSNVYRTRQISPGWRVIPEFKAPQVVPADGDRAVRPPEPGTVGPQPDWSLLPVILVGDRFFFDVRGERSTIATVVSVEKVNASDCDLQ